MATEPPVAPSFPVAFKTIYCHADHAVAVEEAFTIWLDQMQAEHPEWEMDADVQWEEDE